MRRFLVVFDQLQMSRESVKTGSNSPDAVTAVRCVNVGLFLSGALRRNVVVSIGKGVPEDLRVVSFNGATLKRVSPDERSISFFLLKAIQVVAHLRDGASETLDNGIKVERFGLESLVGSWAPETIQIASAECDEFPLPRGEPEHSLLIYEVGGDTLRQTQSLFDALEVPKPPTPERLILDVNMMYDRRLQSS